MRKKSNVLINFLYNSIYQILLIILPLITTPYISRVLNAEGIGLYSYSYSIASVFALVGMLGINNYGSRSIAAYQDDKQKRSETFCNIFAIQFIISTIVLGVYFIYIIFICPEQYKIISIVQSLAILCSLVDINWFFFGMEKFKLTVTRNIVIRIVTVICILLFDVVS